MGWREALMVNPMVQSCRQWWQENVVVRHEDHATPNVSELLMAARREAADANDQLDEIVKILQAAPQVCWIGESPSREDVVETVESVVQELNWVIFLIQSAKEAKDPDLIPEPPPVVEEPVEAPVEAPAPKPRKKRTPKPEAPVVAEPVVVTPKKPRAKKTAVKKFAKRRK